jgi:hypothetical protein
MITDIFDFAIGLRCRLSELGMARSPRTRMTTGTVVGRGNSPNSVRVLFDGATTPVPLHKKYIEAISVAPEYSQAPAATKRPRDVADRSRTRRDGRKLEGDGFLRETFTLPLHAARLKARRFLDAYPAAGHMTIVERWRQLPDGQIEFTMRRLPTAD